MSRFRQILSYARPYRSFAFLNIFFNILYAFFSTISFVALIPMLNVLFKETTPLYEKPVWSGTGYKQFAEDYLNYFVTQRSAIDGEMVVLTYTILLVIGLFFLKNLFNYLALFFITRLRNGLLKELRIALYNKLIGLPVSFFKDRQKGDLMSRLGSDVQEIQQSYLSVLELLVRDPITIVATLTVMMVMSLKLTLFVFILIPLSGLLISRLGKSLRGHSHKQQAEQGLFLSIVEETLSGIRVIKAFNAENLFKRKFLKSSLSFLKYSNAVTNRYNLASPISEFLGIVVIGAVLWQGGQLVLVDKVMNAGSFIVYISLAYNILTPAKSISSAAYSIRKGSASADRVIEILTAENDIKDAPNAIAKQDFSDKIAFKNVTFGYEPATSVIKDFSLDIPKGKIIAFVGPSGSGKSTIVNLLSRFYDVSSGRIEIDGIDIKSISQTSLRHLSGLIQQDSLLFNDTIRNNILISKPDATQQEVEHAAKIANAHGFIEQLPKGYDTNVGDAGSKLSGGQKQRIAIARAVLKNPPIMILDEATSSLDTENEKIVQNALENMMKNRTSVVIAHRLSTIQKAHQIVVIKDGQIIEQGTHEGLMGENSFYKKLVEMQSL